MQGRKKRGQSLGMDTANIKLKNNIYIYIYVHIFENVNRIASYLVQWRPLVLQAFEFTGSVSGYAF